MHSAAIIVESMSDTNTRGRRTGSSAISTSLGWKCRSRTARTPARSPCGSSSSMHPCRSEPSRPSPRASPLPASSSRAASSLAARVEVSAIRRTMSNTKSFENGVERPPLALIAGPTASGKSDLAVRLAQALRAQGLARRGDQRRQRAGLCRPRRSQRTADGGGDARRRPSPVRHLGRRGPLLGGRLGRGRQDARSPKPTVAAQCRSWSAAPGSISAPCSTGSPRYPRSTRRCVLRSATLSPERSPGSAVARRPRPRRPARSRRPHPHRPRARGRALDRADRSPSGSASDPAGSAMR